MMKCCVNFSERARPGFALQMWGDNVVAVFPRFKPGVPITAAKRPLKSVTSDPVWKPVPCWDLHQEGLCDSSLQSAVDIFVDAKVCGEKL
jgi:hypothetical protein